MTDDRISHSFDYDIRKLRSDRNLDMINSIESSVIKVEEDH